LKYLSFSFSKFSKDFNVSFPTHFPDVTIDTIESGPGMFKVNAVYRNTRFEGVGYNLNLAKRRAAKKLLEVITNYDKN